MTVSGTIERKIYSVSRLNRESRFLLSDFFGSIWVEGEISNLASPSSGHIYFSLKDGEAQVRCALFRPQARSLKFAPKNGDFVVARAEVSLYEPRGEFQLTIQSLELGGDGDLLREFEALKSRLAKEGLFDATYKKPIPKLARCIGVITSPTGAAIRDILSVLGRRFASIPVIIFPTKVQGLDAKHEIVKAIQYAERLGLCDLLILARGGGSLEDLWPFNEEVVARAIHASTIPIISGVGHETDFTIADFVADLRAPTPSAAAEAGSPDGASWLEVFRTLESRLALNLNHLLTLSGHFIERAHSRLYTLHPDRQLAVQFQRLDELEQRLLRASANQLVFFKSRLDIDCHRLLSLRPDREYLQLTESCTQLGRRLDTVMLHLLERKNHSLSNSCLSLQTVSPLATLARGYSITMRAEDEKLVRSLKDAPPGTEIVTRLMDGKLLSVITDCLPCDDQPLK